MPAQLPLPLIPLRGSAPLTGELACLTPACWSTPGVGLEGSCCATWFAPMCRTLPQGLQRALLSLLQVTLGFSGHLGPVLLLSWRCGLGFSPSLLFWTSPAPLACWGSWGFAPCVRVLQLKCCLIGLQVRSPCCLSLTLEWVCFWPMVSQVFVGCEGGLCCPLWFVILFLCLLVLHLFWGWGGLVTGLWPLLRLLVLDSSDAWLHRLDALASDCYATPISGHWMV